MKITKLDTKILKHSKNVLFSFKSVLFWVFLFHVFSSDLREFRWRQLHLNDSSLLIGETTKFDTSSVARKLSTDMKCRQFL